MSIFTQFFIEKEPLEGPTGSDYLRNLPFFSSKHASLFSKSSDQILRLPSYVLLSLCRLNFTRGDELKSSCYQSMANVRKGQDS